MKSSFSRLAVFTVLWAAVSLPSAAGELQCTTYFHGFRGTLRLRLNYSYLLGRYPALVGLNEQAQDVIAKLSDEGTVCVKGQSVIDGHNNTFFATEIQIR